jgi:hypothetical protein
LPVYRLRLWVRVGGEYAQRQAVLDTGAPLTIFSKQVWAPLHARGAIEWISPAPAAGQPLSRTTVLHGTYPIRLGRIQVQPVDLATGALRATRILVQCTEDERQQPNDPEPLPRLLIFGMAELLIGRKLTVEVSPDGTVWEGFLYE